MKTVLPVEKPVVTSFTHQACVHAILQTKPEAKPWIYSNYIDLYCVRDMFTAPRRSTLDFFFNVYGDFSFYEHSTCWWLLMNRYPRNVVKNYWGNELSFVRDRINEGEYVFLVINRKFLDGFYEDNFHPALIYGFDDDEQCIYFSDNNYYGKYSFQKITYERFVLANDVPLIEDMSYSRPEGICTFRIRENHTDIGRCIFQIDKVINDLKNYISPQMLKVKEFARGIDCYEELIKYYQCFINSKEQNPHIDLRGTCALLDHKKLMTLRCGYLYNNSYLNTDISEIYKKSVEEKIRIVVNKLIKYRIQNNDRLLSESIELLKEAREAELQILSEVINLLDAIQL